MQIVQTGDILQENDELIATKAPNEVLGTEAPLQPARCLLQDAVALRMPKAVIDILEAVQVKQNQRGFPRTLGVQERLLNLTFTAATVVDLRERISHRLVLGLLQHLLLEAGIGNVLASKQYEPTLHVECAIRDLHRTGLAILPKLVHDKRVLGVFLQLMKDVLRIHAAQSYLPFRLGHTSLDVTQGLLPVVATFLGKAPVCFFVPHELEKPARLKLYDIRASARVPDEELKNGIQTLPAVHELNHKKGFLL